MADDYDSILKIKAEFDLDDMKRSAKELGDAVEEALNQNSGNTDELIRAIMQALEEASERAKVLSEEIDKIKNKKAPTEEYKELAKELQEAEDALFKIKALQAQATDEQEKAELQPMVDQAQQRVNDVHERMLQLIKDGKAFTIGDPEKLKKKTLELNKVLGTMRNLLVKLKGMTFDKITAHFKKLSEAAKQARRTVKQMIKGLIGFSTITAVFSKLRAAFKEGFGYLEQFDGKTIKFKTELDEFKKSLMYLKNSIATAFAPLVSAVVPYLQAAANALADLMTKLGAFFAMMTGKSVMIQAKKNTEEYDKALQKAGGSAKKLNAELYGFDTLNKQQDKSGGGGVNGANMFEEVAVDKVLSQDVRNFIDELKELWNNKNFYGLGAKIAEGLNTGVEKLDEAVKNARGKLESGAKGFAEGLNGLVETFKAGKFGTLIADSISTAFGTENAFLDEFHFDSLGEKLADMLSHILTDTEWDEVGRNWALKINGIFSFLEGFLSNKDLLPNAAKAIKETIFGFFDNIEPEHISNSIKLLIENVANFVADTDWGDVFGTAFNGLLGIVDWAVDTIANIDWSKVGEAIGKLLMELRLWLFSPERIVKTAGHIFSWVLKLVSSVVQFILGMIKGAFGPVIEKFTDLGLDTITGFFQGIKDTFDVWISAAKKWFQSLVDAVKELFGIASPSKVFGDIGGFIIEGLKKGIEDTWNKVKDGLFKTFDSLKSKVKDIFGISSPSKVFAEYGKFIDLGFVEGIEGEKSAVEHAMEDMMESAQPDAEITPSLNTDNLIINLDGALARLSMIAEKFQMIADTFRVIGNVPIPALVTGGVVPPNAYGSYGATSDNGLISKIQELIDRLDGGSSPVEVHAHLELDGREIYDTVVTQNNNQIQRTGTSRIKV